MTIQIPPQFSDLAAMQNWVLEELRKIDQLISWSERKVFIPAPIVIGGADYGEFREALDDPTMGSTVVVDGTKIRTATVADSPADVIGVARGRGRAGMVHVALLGVVPVLKGQVMGDRWLKMRDIDDVTEEWHIR